MARGRAKISVIGAGNVGATAAQYAALKELGDVVVVDIKGNFAKGKCLDLNQNSPIWGTDFYLSGSDDYDTTKNSDVVIVTAAIPRKPGMSRDDLLATNTKIVSAVIKEVAPRSPDAVLIIVSNPLDVMTWVAREVSGFDKNRVMGMAGILDTGRFRHFLARELDCSVEDVFAYVLGGHGDSMVPLVRYTTMAGIPIEDLMPRDKIDAIVERTKTGGGEIVGLLETGSAFYAPGCAAVLMADSILRDKKRVQPCAAFLSGEFGHEDIPIGVPVKLGKNGVEEIIAVKLTADEQKLLDSSAQAVKETIEKARTMLTEL